MSSPAWWIPCRARTCRCLEGLPGDGGRRTHGTFRLACTAASSSRLSDHDAVAQTALHGDECSLQSHGRAVAHVVMEYQ